MVSNRLPFSFRRAPGGQAVAQPASGGLVTALMPVLRERGGMWIGWPGTLVPPKRLAAAVEAASDEMGCELVTVPLAAAQVRDFYLGFSNEIVWPLFHDFLSKCNFEERYWKTYCAVNRRFARTVHQRSRPGDFVWVHDYHLMNLAAELERLGNACGKGFFLHIPFPAPDIFLKLPWRLSLVRALLKFDLIGFQTEADRRNFRACVRALGLRPGRVRLAHHPISIDFEGFARRAAEEDVGEMAAALHRLLPGRRLALGIDRLDYTKGIPLRLRAFRRLLREYPDMRGRVSLMQVVVPSREDIPEYHRLRAEIEQLVGEINGTYARPGGWVPVWYEYRSLTRLELLAYYRAADIAVLTPLKDGMNLVAKEYCACSIEEDCVLILSEFAGAAAQLADGALRVNPCDEAALAQAIRAAVLMPAAERTARMRRLRAAVRRHDVFRWVERFLADAGQRGLRAGGAVRRAGARAAPPAQLPI
ncbi:MAG: alpha,alpha-trehalose-phosphate synthase (UDP-forming) [Betaproteobacteria bacterium]